MIKHSFIYLKESIKFKQRVLFSLKEKYYN